MFYYSLYKNNIITSYFVLVETKVDTFSILTQENMLAV